MAFHCPVIFHCCMLGYTFRKVLLKYAGNVSVAVSAAVSFAAFDTFIESWHVYFRPFVAAASYL